MAIFDARRCLLGEGVLWHAPLGRLYWVDILNNKVLWGDDNGVGGEITFVHPVSAMASASATSLIAADDRSLFEWDLVTQSRTTLCDLEPEISDNRANDGRADPWGGFWIGTMDREARGSTGSIYRWYRGELRKLVPDITIPNALCFDRERRRAYYTDTPTHCIFRIECDADGWPTGNPEVHCDLSEQRIFVDGAVTDRLGHIRAACWDLAAVITVSPDGSLTNRLDMPTARPTCTAFGGPELRHLFVTSAAFGLDKDAGAGATYRFEDAVGGEPVPYVAITAD